MSDINVYFDFPLDDRESVTRDVPVVPRIGESVGVTPCDPPNERFFRIDKVLDVRHYVTGPRPEIRVLVGSP